MVHPEQQHLDIISDILANGDHQKGRNGAYRSLFMRSMKFDVTPNRDGSISIPVSTTAGTFLRGVIAEFESFFIRGESDSKILEEDGINIWRDNTRDTDGIIGPAYGHNYRNYGGSYDESGVVRDGVDQVETLITEALENPGSRRLIILNSDPRVNDDCVLHPCQMLFQVYLSPCVGDEEEEERYRLDIHAYNRSSDIACAGMWNTAFATLVAAYISAQLSHRGLPTTPRYVHVTFGNVHVYENQVSMAVEHTSRVPTGIFPKVVVDGDRVIIKESVKTEYSGIRYILNP
jgi:thymidylate synthase